MKILHVSHNQLKSLGSRNYSLPVRINNGFIRNNHEVFWFSDRDTARYSSVFGSSRSGAGACNRKFLQVCHNFVPDIIALCSADLITPETLIAARKSLPNTAIFQYFIDPLFVESNLNNVKKKSGVVDMTFVTTAGPVLANVAGKRSRAAFIPNPVDPSIDSHHCHEKTDLSFDVFFAGLDSPWQDPSDLRVTAHDLIKKELPTVHCAFFGPGYASPVYGAEFMRLLGQSRIGLNFSQRSNTAKSGPGGELYLYSSDRIGQYLGNGLLVFSTAAFSLSELYGVNTIIEVNGPDDFVDKIRYYLNNDQELRKIAGCGYELAHREFNERLVSQYMVESVLGLSFSHPYNWPTETFG